MSTQKYVGIDASTAGRGVLVFAAGMALAAASFLVEQLVIKTVKTRG